MADEKLTPEQQALVDALPALEVPQGFERKYAVGEISTVLGQKQSKPIAFAYQWLQAKTPQILRESGKWPNDDSVLGFYNSTQERNGLSSARAAAMKDTAETIAKTVEYRRNAFVEMSVKNGVPRELAEGLAAQHIKE